MRFTTYILAASAVLSGVYAGLEDVTSTVKLTKDNFDSAIAGKNSLVAFFAPWCGHCKNLAPVWQKLGNAFEGEESVLIGQLDADNADNRPVAQRYGVKGYPTLKFFPADGSAPVDYQSGRTENAFLEFINAQAGTHRTVGGLLDTLAGRIPSLDELATSFLTSTADVRASVSKKASELAATYKGPTEAAAAAYYVKVMEKVAASNEWAHKELARLQKLASKRGALAGKQLDDLQIRQNILGAFTAAKASASSLASDASAAVNSAGSEAAKSASSVSVAAEAAASSLASQAATASGQAAVAAGDALSVGQAHASEASATLESAASIASASLESAASVASASAASAYDAASAAASSGVKKVAGEL